MSSKLYHRCARLLCLNTPDDLTQLYQLLRTILHNIISEPLNEKFQTIKLSNVNIQSRLVNRSGGIEFLLAVGFKKKTIDEDNERALVMKISALDMIVNVDNLQRGLIWLQDTAATSRQMKLHHRVSTSLTDSSAYCAECIIQIKSSTFTITGGFMANDTIQDILDYVKCHYLDDKADEVILCYPYDTKALTPDKSNQTLYDACLYPRGTVVASILTDSLKEQVCDSTMVSVKSDAKARLDALAKVKREKQASREKEEKYRGSVLQAFKDDHGKS